MLALCDRRLPPLPRPPTPRSEAERNEWVAAIGRATTESRRVRSYSEEVEYQEQQAARRAMTSQEAPEDAPTARRGSHFT